MRYKHVNTAAEVSPLSVFPHLAGELAPASLDP